MDMHNVLDSLIFISFGVLNTIFHIWIQSEVTIFWYYMLLQGMLVVELAS